MLLVQVEWWKQITVIFARYEELLSGSKLFFLMVRKIVAK
jgi:hypothetical protein